MKPKKTTASMGLNAPGYRAFCVVSKRCDGKKSIAVPVKAIRQMLEDYETLMDRVAVEELKQKKTAFFPQPVLDALLAGGHPLKVFREHRGFTQVQLAKRSGVSRDMIAMIETHKKTGSVATIRKLASALDLEMEDLL